MWARGGEFETNSNLRAYRCPETAGQLVRRGTPFVAVRNAPILMHSCTQLADAGPRFTVAGCVAVCAGGKTRTIRFHRRCREEQPGMPGPKCARAASSG